MKRVQQGFTLIELMIVVAIVGILAAIALPAYQDYTIRAQVTEALVLTDGVKSAVGDYYANKGDFPTTNALAGVSDSINGKYVSTVTVGTSGAITALFGGSSVNSLISGSTVTLTPTASSSTGSITWGCSSNAANKYLPVSCRSSS
jgi:type IV pilus assembly protein PilA